LQIKNKYRDLIYGLIYLIMEAILVHPNSEDQAETIKAVLQALKVPFETTKSNLPEHVVLGINKGLLDLKEGRVTSLEDVKKFISSK
jgi:hypothetical protein